MKIHWMKTSTVLGLVLAAVAAPAAFGQQDLRSPDARDAAAVAAEEAYLDLRNPDTRDMAEGGPGAPKVTFVEVPVAAASESGLDWGDVGIGAGAMLGLILLGSAGMLAATHRKGSGGRPATSG